MATEINPFDLFVQAGPVVRAVAIILGVLSLWCWAIIANAILGLARLKKVEASLARAAGASDRAGVREAGMREIAVAYSDEALSDRRQRVQSAMRRRAQQFTEQCQGNLGSLAVIASVAPFVGLFGTVWGIMTSFIGIAAAKDTSLAVVAPGIAEALAATALGLAAAIPAAFAYNRLATAFGKASRALARQVDALVPEVSDSQPLHPAQVLTRVA